ncbi:MAG: CRISPR-associated protein Cas4 [Anaerolineaceae bacterium]
MILEFSENDLLALSGIQHFQFCRRQWALIHIERQWKENLLTTDGKIMHDRADNPFFHEVREGVITSRGMPVASYSIGLYGVCDVVEFTPSPDGVVLKGHIEKYIPVPIEYKRGTEKNDECDIVQLCAQALCLEEMLSVRIKKGYLFYGENKRRLEVLFDQRIRDKVISLTAEMHAYFQRGYTPQGKPSKACKSCSLSDICLPVLQERIVSASKYIQTNIEGD